MSKREVIIACDFEHSLELGSFLEKLQYKDAYLKIGMEMFYNEGPMIVRQLKEMGYKIFLDLKLHDIPTTVRKAMYNLAKLNIDMVNVHAAGGKKMMEEAMKGLVEGSKAQGVTPPKLIAVTQLTSTSKEMMNDELCIPGEVADIVRSYTNASKEAGLDGVVCSPLEASLVEEMGMISVTPGIRFSMKNAHDQVRVTTPEQARELGSSYIVVGRAITAADNVKTAYERCIKEFVG